MPEGPLHRMVPWMPWFTLGVCCPALASDSLHIEPVRWFGDPPGVLGSPLGSPVEGPHGDIYGVTRRAGSLNPDFIYRWSPSRGAFEVVARVPEINAMMRDDDHGLLVSTASHLVAVSTSGVVRELARFRNPNGTGTTPICGAVELVDGWIYGLTQSGGENGTGYIYRVRRDGTGFTIHGSLPGYPYSGVGAEEFGAAPLRPDGQGGVYGVLGPGHYTWGGWLGGGGYERGKSAIFRISGPGWFRYTPLPVTFALDAALRPDGSFSVLAGPRNDPISLPRTAYRLTPSDQALTRITEAPSSLVLVPGTALDTNRTLWAVASSGARASTNGDVGGVVSFPAALNSAVGITPFPVDADPLFAKPEGGLILVGGNLYGHARAAGSGGCLYRVGPGSRIENVLTFAPHSAEPERRASQGPVVTSEGSIVVATLGPSPSASLRLNQYQPTTRIWEEFFGAGAAGLTNISSSDRRPGVTPGPSGVLWIVESSATPELFGLRVLRHSKTSRTVEVAGELHQTMVDWQGDNERLTRATDGRWYGTAPAGDSAESAGCIYRVHATEPGLEVVVRFPANGSLGQIPFDGLVEAEKGWLYGLVQKAPGLWPRPGMFRVRLKGHDFESLGALPGNPLGGQMQGRDGNLYCLVRLPNAGEGIGLLRTGIPSHQMEVIARWPESLFGKLQLDGPPIQGPDRRFYATGHRDNPNKPAVIVSVAESGSDPRVDAELDEQLGTGFMPPLAIGPYGWIYAATTGGGQSGDGGLLRFRPRPELRASTNRVEIRAFPGASARLETASRPEGPWTSEGLTLDADGTAVRPHLPAADPVFFRVILADGE